jgi:hypothetical protein
MKEQRVQLTSFLTYKIHLVPCLISSVTEMLTTPRNLIKPSSLGYLFHPLPFGLY